MAEVEDELRDALENAFDPYNLVKGNKTFDLSSGVMVRVGYM